ncbi:MAG TPA: DcaP family trimeric outer membrane transporter [Stellaceae bacterium]|nr:DcaP family trimeric outer membrane transporter [Stellaceae bacterium]
MTKARKLSSIAVLGGSTAALAMLTGLAGARADDMQLNQQLLNQRIDQLAAVGLQPGAGAVFAIDENKAAGAPVTAGSFPRSILIPGTDTSIKIYGQITEVIDYELTGGNPNSSPQTTTIGDNGQVQSIPLPGSVARARGNGIFQQSPRESKIGFETRTPTPFGEARTVFEFDWAGSTTFAPAGTSPTAISDNLVPRLRYAYGTLGGLLAGQATSNFSDPDANAETLDFGGNVGEPGHVRVPQIRYTMPSWWGTSFSVSAETPQTIIATANGLEGSDAGVIPTATTSCATAGAGSAASAAASTCTTTLLTSGVTPLNITKAAAPDLTAAWYIPQPWGHLDFSAVLRPGVVVEDGHFFSHQYIGYGGHFGADFKPGWFGWAKDDFIVHFTIGDTIGAFLNSSTNFDLATNYGLPSTSPTTGTYGGFNGPTSAAAASLISFKPTQEMGGEIGYQHWWLDNLRSNINGGFNAHYGIPIKLVGAAQAASINKELLTGHANLIWNPVSFVDIGLEYMWGQRTVLNNTNASMQVLISKFAFRF